MDNEAFQGFAEDTNLHELLSRKNATNLNLVATSASAKKDECRDLLIIGNDLSVASAKSSEDGISSFTKSNCRFKSAASDTLETQPDSEHGINTEARTGLPAPSSLMVSSCNFPKLETKVGPRLDNLSAM